jgi:hypothetical protein
VMRSSGAPSPWCVMMRDGSANVRPA